MWWLSDGIAYSVKLCLAWGHCFEDVACVVADNRKEGVAAGSEGMEGLSPSPLLLFGVPLPCNAQPGRLLFSHGLGCCMLCQLVCACHAHMPACYHPGFCSSRPAAPPEGCVGCIGAQAPQSMCLGGMQRRALKACAFPKPSTCGGECCYLL